MLLIFEFNTIINTFLLKSTDLNLSKIFYPGSRRPQALPVDECASVWPACPEFRRGMSLRWGVK
jgi:hypothetical protein